jgi:hypothetical protein
MILQRASKLTIFRTIAALALIVLVGYETYLSFVRALSGNTYVEWYAWLWSWPGSRLIISGAKALGMHPSLESITLLPSAFLFLGAFVFNLGWLTLEVAVIKNLAMWAKTTAFQNQA